MYKLNIILQISTFHKFRFKKYFEKESILEIGDE